MTSRSSSSRRSHVNCDHTQPVNASLGLSVYHHGDRIRPSRPPFVWLCSPDTVQLHSTLTTVWVKPGFHSNAIACVGKQPIMVATASTEHSYWLALAFVAWKLSANCVSCGFRLRNARNASDCVWMETGLDTQHYCQCSGARGQNNVNRAQTRR